MLCGRGSRPPRDQSFSNTLEGFCRWFPKQARAACSESLWFGPIRTELPGRATCFAAAEIRGGVERPARPAGAEGKARPGSDGAQALARASLLKAPGAYRQPGQVTRGCLCTLSSPGWRLGPSLPHIPTRHRPRCWRVGLFEATLLSTATWK